MISKSSFLIAFLACVVLLGSSANSSAQTNVSGAISQNTTWTLNGSPYIVTGDVTVLPGVNLTIQPGVEVKFAGNYSFTVDGTLNAVGTASQMVVFTSNNSSPAPGDWQYIRPSQSSIIRFVTIEYSNYGVFVTTNPTIQDCLFQHNNQGVRIEYNSLSPVFSTNTIINNDYGIYILGGQGPVINNNNIYNNNIYNIISVNNGYGGNINAENNWWGTTDVNLINSKINDSGSVLIVDFAPFLDAPNGNPIGQQYLMGYFFQNTHLTATNIPYVVVKSLHVRGTSTLTIDPGVTVKFKPGCDLDVFWQATLIAQGTAAQRIVFTSDQAVPARGDWGRIIMSASSVVRFATIEYATQGLTVGSISPTLEDNIIQNNLTGLYLTGSSLVRNNTIISNNYGVIIYSGFPTINDNSIHSNSLYNLSLSYVGSPVNVERNWWGTIDPQVIFNAIQLVNSVPVDFTPFLDAPNGNPIGNNVITGYITQNTHLTLANSPYFLLNTVIVLPGVTLTIDPGVQIRCLSQSLLDVQGTLVAQGASGQLINFVSASTTPTWDDWQGILIRGSGPTGGVIKYVRIQHAINAILIDNRSPVFENNILENNRTGLYITLSNTAFQFNQITNNFIGVSIASSSFGYRVNNNSINGNVVLDVHSIVDYGVGQIANFENNWWGTTDPAVINAHIFDYRDDAMRCPYVDFIPFLNYQGEITFPITNVSISQQFFSPITPETTQINYDLPIAADVTIKIQDFYTNQVVRTLLLNQPRSVGPHAEIWDGKNDQNVVISGGIYNFSIEAVDSVAPSRGIYVPAPYFSPRNPITNGTLSPVNFDPYKGEVATISYDISAPSIVRVKAGIPDQHVVMASRDLIVNQGRESLGNTEIWDGRDNNGNIVDPRAYAVYGWAYVLPGNTIVVQNDSPDIDFITTNPYAIHPLFGETSEIRYRVSQNGRVRILIKDPGNNLVKTLMNFTQQAAGEYTIVWDGKDSQGNIVPVTGHYKVEITVTDPTAAISRTRVGNITVFK